MIADAAGFLHAVDWEVTTPGNCTDFPSTHFCVRLDLLRHVSSFSKNNSNPQKHDNKYRKDLVDMKTWHYEKKYSATAGLQVIFREKNYPALLCN